MRGDEAVVLELWNHNPLRDTFIGRVTVSFSDCSVRRRRTKLQLDCGGVLDCTFQCSEEVFSARLLAAKRVAAYAPPDRVLWVAVRRAVELKNVQWLGAQDPYVVVSLVEALEEVPATAAAAELLRASIQAESQQRPAVRALTLQDGGGGVMRLRTKHDPRGGKNPRWSTEMNNVLLFVPDVRRHKVSYRARCLVITLAAHPSLCTSHHSPWRMRARFARILSFLPRQPADGALCFFLQWII